MRATVLLLALVLGCGATPSVPRGTLVMPLKVPHSGIRLERVTLLNLLTSERIVVFPVRQCLLLSHGRCAFPVVISPSEVLSVVPPSWLCSREAHEAGGLRGAVEMTFPTQNAVDVDWLFHASDTAVCEQIDLTQPEWASTDSIRILLLLICVPLVLTYAVVAVCKLRCATTAVADSEEPEATQADMARWHQRMLQRSHAVFAQWVPPPTDIEM